MFLHIYILFFQLIMANFCAIKFIGSVRGKKRLARIWFDSGFNYYLLTQFIF